MDEQFLLKFGIFYNAELNRVVFKLGVPKAASPVVPARLPEPVHEPMPSPLHDTSIVRAGIEQLDLRSSQDSALTALRTPTRTASIIVPLLPEVEVFDPPPEAIPAVGKASSAYAFSFRGSKTHEQSDLHTLEPASINNEKSEHGYTKPAPMVVDAMDIVPRDEPPPAVVTPAEKKKQSTLSFPGAKGRSLVVKPEPSPPKSESGDEEMPDVPPEDDLPPKPVVKKAAPKAPAKLPQPTPAIPGVRTKVVPPKVVLAVLGPPGRSLKPTALTAEEEAEGEGEEVEPEDEESEGPNSEMEGEETDLGESEPSDAEDLDVHEDENEEDVPEEFTEERRAKLKEVERLVRLPYEQRFANQIADINEEFDAKQVPKAAAKGKGKGKKSVQFADATAENRPIGIQRLAAPDKPVEEPNLKSAAALRKLLRECEAQYKGPRASGLKTKLSLSAPIPDWFIKVFQACWKDAVYVAICEQIPQDKASTYRTNGEDGKQCESGILELVKRIVTLPVPEHLECLVEYRRMVWAYEKMTIFEPKNPQDDSVCELVFEHPREHQAFFNNPTNKITLYYIQIPPFVTMRDAMCPYEFCRRYARLETADLLRYFPIFTAEAIEKKLLTGPDNRHQKMLYSWWNAQLLAHFNFVLE